MISVTFKSDSETVAHLYVRRVGEHLEIEDDNLTGRRMAEYFYEIFRPASPERETQGGKVVAQGTVLHPFPNDLLRLVQVILEQEEKEADLKCPTS